nr:hypothetical protein BaRGS_013924 [Batillaria attramentaria]
MGRKVLVVLTSHGQLGTTGKPTGWYLPEVAHPYYVFKAAGYSITFISPKGGKAPMDPGSGEAFKDDPICQQFLADKEVMNQINNTLTAAQVSASDFDVVFYAGGHGPMYDLPDNSAIAALATQVYEKGGILSAVCHGTVGFVPVKLSNGDSVLKGQAVTSFSNSEEEAVNLTEAMPFLLETRLKKLGANYTAAPNFQPHVVVSGRLVTGQNPASATGTAESVVKLLSA